MAFAGGSTAEKSNPFITEKEIIKQVASNITKDALITTKIMEIEDDSSQTKSVTESKLNGKSVADAKRHMLENLNKVQKVWYAFVKFIKNQVTVNGKLVDTQTFGLFYRDNDNNGNVVFLPSVEYLEAGKFKLSKTNNETVANLSLEQYSAKYQDLVQSAGKS